MINTIKKRKLPIFIIAVLILATLFMIYSNSLKGPEESSDFSGEWVEIIKPIVDPDDSVNEDIFEFRLRKTAHFLEFCLLAIECTLLYIICLDKAPCLMHFLLIVSFIALSALADETVQVFSQRGSSVIDVWIDLSGGLCGCLATTLITAAVLRLKGNSQKQTKKHPL